MKQPLSDKEKRALRLRLKEKKARIHRKNKLKKIEKQTK